MKRFCAAAALVVSCACLSLAGDYGAESLLETGAGARAAAMGGAVCASADDSSAVFYNPAGLVKIPRQEVSLMHYPMMGGVLYNSVTYGQPVLGIGYFGGSFFRAAIDGIERFDGSNENAGSYGYGEMKAGVSYAREIVAGVSAGATLNIFNFSMAEVNSYGFGLDVGVLYEPFSGLNFGLSVRNFMNPELKMSVLTEQAAKAFTLGAAYRITAGDFDFLVGADALKNDDSNFRFRAGAEAAFVKTAFLRAGFNDGEISLGAGVSLFDVGIDYSFTLNDVSGGLSRFNLSYDFGLTLNQQEEQKKEEMREQVKKFIDEEFKKKERDRAREYFAKAAALFAKGMLEEALQEAANALEWDKDYKEAGELSRKISKAMGKAYFEEGKKSYAAGNYALALESLRKASDSGMENESKDLIEKIKKQFSMSQASSQLFAKGVEYYVNKKYNEAIAEWQRALVSDPDNSVIKGYVARARKEMGQAAASGKLTQQDTDRIKELYMDGLKKYTEGQLQEAVDTWKKILSISPGDIKALKSIEKAQAEINELKKRGIK